MLKFFGDFQPEGSNLVTQMSKLFGLHIMKHKISSATQTTHNVRTIIYCLVTVHYGFAY